MSNNLLLPNENKLKYEDSYGTIVSRKDERDSPVSLGHLLPAAKSVAETGIEYLNAGLSVIPLNKKKKPSTSEWEAFMHHRADIDTIRTWTLGKNGGIGIVCGAVSGNVEVIDFDEKYNVEPEPIFTRWKEMVERQKPGLVDRLVLEKSQNNGFHIIFRCKVVGRNTKLAMRGALEIELQAEPDVKALTLIETRGEGGYLMCHPSSGYSIIAGSLFNIPEISIEERNVLLECARAFNQYVNPSKMITGLSKRPRSSKQHLPGDEFNERGDIAATLQRHGWKKIDQNEAQEYWQRPGKREGISATYHLTLHTFYVFSSNAAPFDNDKAYSKFAVYAFLEHDGNFEQAAKTLAEQGYGVVTAAARGVHELGLVEEYLRDRYEFRVNEVTQQLEWRCKGQGTFERITDMEFNSIYRELHANKLPVGADVLNRVLYSDYSELVNPFREYFAGIPTWDGTTDHIEALSESVTLKDDTDKANWKIALRRWLIGQVACAIDDAEVNQTAIILVGGQGLGKSYWLNRLIPPTLTKYRFVGTIDPNNKDSYIYLAETMLINLDELETLKKGEIGTLKTLMTMPSIKSRRPYDRFPTVAPRRASFVGSINSTEFLNDPTGSGRFLVFEASAIDYNHNVKLYKSGELWWFDQQEIAQIMDRNKKHSIHSYEHELLSQYFEPGNDGLVGSEWKTCTEIAEVLHKIHSVDLPMGKTEYNFTVNDKSVRNLGYALTSENYPWKKIKGSKQYCIKRV